MAEHDWKALPAWWHSRREFLRGAGLTGAGLVSTGLTGTTLAGAALAGTGIAAAELAGAEAPGAPDFDGGDRQAAGTDRSSVTDPGFTIAVIPDTQFLFDSDRGDPAPLAASLAYLLDHRTQDNIVFVAHLGDIVENAAEPELRRAGRVFEALDQARMPYSVLAGNHDIDSRTDDRRGPSPYLDVFGTQRFVDQPTFGGATASGYNTYHVFRAAGRDWLLLALDWRPSDGTLAWARQVLRRHPRSPAILTTHELAAPERDGSVIMHPHGLRLWNDLIRGNDQIFLAINGHFWPAGRTVLRNNAGNEVHLHVTNYQNRYYGGSGMIRLYRFDTARNVIDIRTIAPWIMAQPPGRRNHLAQREIELTDPQNSFSVPIDFAARFAGFTPVPPPRRRPAGANVVPGTVAYWRFDPPDSAGPDGDSLLVAGRPIKDLSGRGNHLTAVALPGQLQPVGGGQSTGGARLTTSAAVGRQPKSWTYLRTAAGAPVNAATFARGYTIEARLKLPTDAFLSHARMGILSRLGTGSEAGRTAGDPADPLADLGVADGLALRWAAFPLHRNAVSTNWSHELPVDRWFHAAVVNDGRTTTMYIDGEPVLRNPATPAVGLASTGRPWLVGASHHGGTVARPFRGSLGEIRIVDRPLARAQFLA